MSYHSNEKLRSHLNEKGSSYKKQVLHTSPSKDKRMPLSKLHKSPLVHGQSMPSKQPQLLRIDSGEPEVNNESADIPDNEERIPTDAALNTSIQSSQYTLNNQHSELVLVKEELNRKNQEIADLKLTSKQRINEMQQLDNLNRNLCSQLEDLKSNTEERLYKQQMGHQEQLADFQERCKLQIDDLRAQYTQVNDQLRYECEKAKTELKFLKIDHSSLIQNIDVKEELRELREVYVGEVQQTRYQLDMFVKENHELREQNGLYQKKLTEVETQNQGLLKKERQIEAKYGIAKQKLDDALRIIENSKQMLEILQEIKSQMSQLQQNKSQLLGSKAAGDYSQSKKIVYNPNHHARSLTLMEQKLRDLEKSFASTQQDTLRLYESPFPSNNTTPIDLKMAKQRSQANRQKTPVLQNRQPHKSPLMIIKPPHETIDLNGKFDKSQLTKQEEQKRMGFLNVSTMKSHTPVVTRNDAVKKPSLLFKPTQSMANKIDESQALNTTMGSDLYPMSKVGTSFNQSNNLVAFFSSPEKRLLQGQKVDGLVGSQGLALSRKHKEENQRLKVNQKTPSRAINESSLLKGPESKIQFENKFNLHNLLEGNEINQDDTIDIKYSEFSEKHGLTIIPQSNLHEKSFLSSMDYRSHGLEGNVGGARNPSDQQDYTIMAQKLALYELLYKQAESTSQSLREELEQFKKQQPFVSAEKVPNVTLNVNTTNVTCFNIGCSQTTNNHELIIDPIQARPEQKSKREQKSTKSTLKPDQNENAAQGSKWTNFLTAKRVKSVDRSQNGVSSFQIYSNKKGSFYPEESANSGHVQFISSQGDTQQLPQRVISHENGATKSIGQVHIEQSVPTMMPKGACITPVAQKRKYSD
ncbi:hypothetical protein FGO68_gene14346 [Halteria grandinella]|uniref:Uncharacterized protein n=1 Tax=Halteria grandinella TaxID=5974 RepID=A0A8J8NZY5_HALGN|nr:hypothetical protein FGO68_gene14346 [Halteria grandinella]